MDLRQIKYFLAVAEERNITRASEKLHLSQPPLSRALMDLEEELGCTLLIRGKRNVTLTPEGHALKRRGEQLLALTDITKDEIKGIKQGVSGTLYIGHVDAGGPTLVARWIESFNKEYPDVTYNLWSGTVDDLTDRMRAGLIDLAVTLSPTNNDLLDSVKVFSENWVALIPEGHPLAKNGKDSVSVDEMADDDLIISSRKSREEEIREWFRSTGRDPRFIVKTAHSSNASRLVERGIGIALFPASVADSIPAGTGVVIKTITPEVTLSYRLSWDKEKPLNALAGKFVGHVRELYEIQ
ncbi:MAG: LysR family transcriptional regulator [Clostridiales bacterium]|nr:LysR family transcriptional regulator [Clostridiales bacterium]